MRSHLSWWIINNIKRKKKENMLKNRFLFSILAIWLAIVSCNLPQGSAPQVGLSAADLALTVTALSAPGAAGAPAATTPVVVSTVGSPATEAAVVPSLPPQPTATLVPTPTPCTPAAVANSAVNVRSGPGTVYPTVGALTQGSSVPIAGKSADGTWWYIPFSSGVGGYGWVSGGVVTAACLPATLAVIAAPPTPLPPSGTCKEGFVFRLARSTDKVCVPPASKAQAEADNAAADSRKLVSVYGADACTTGYVWRDAFSGDHVCVTAAVRSQAAADNTAAASRWVSGSYGAHTCIPGFVWREAGSGDDVCVDASVRTQALSDNAAASSRLATAVDGPDACIPGYVWRHAFSGDRVCVTSEVQSQVAADNAAAPSHTWP